MPAGGAVLVPPLRPGQKPPPPPGGPPPAGLGSGLEPLRRESVTRLFPDSQQAPPQPPRRPLLRATSLDSVPTLSPQGFKPPPPRGPPPPGAERRNSSSVPLLQPLSSRPSTDGSSSNGANSSASLAAASMSDLSKGGSMAPLAPLDPPPGGDAAAAAGASRRPSAPFPGGLSKHPSPPQGLPPEAASMGPRRHSLQSLPTAAAVATASAEAAAALALAGVAQLRRPSGDSSAASAAGAPPPPMQPPPHRRPSDASQSTLLTAAPGAASQVRRPSGDSISSSGGGGGSCAPPPAHRRPSGPPPGPPPLLEGGRRPSGAGAAALGAGGPMVPRLSLSSYCPERAAGAVVGDMGGLRSRRGSQQPPAVEYRRYSITGEAEFCVPDGGEGLGRRPSVGSDRSGGGYGGAGAIQGHVMTAIVRALSLRPAGDDGPGLTAVQCFNQGVTHQRHGEQAAAAAMYARAAEMGHPKAQHNLAAMYEKGVSGMAKDDREAVRLFTLAAEAGLAESSYSLAMHFKLGLGCEQDDGKCVHYLERASGQGLPKAQFNLGLMYEKGRGIAPDVLAAEALDAAKECYRSAAMAGVPKPRRRHTRIITASSPPPSLLPAPLQAAVNLGVLYLSAVRHVAVCCARQAHATGRACLPCDARRAVGRRPAAAAEHTGAEATAHFTSAPTALVSLNCTSPQPRRTAAAHAPLSWAPSAEAAMQSTTSASTAHGTRLCESQPHSLLQLTRGRQRASLRCAGRLAADGGLNAEAEAVRWFRRAADYGDASAKWNLALCYQRGIGVPADAAMAQRLRDEVDEIEQSASGVPAAAAAVAHAGAAPKQQLQPPPQQQQAQQRPEAFYFRRESSDSTATLDGRALPPQLQAATAAAAAAAAPKASVTPEYPADRKPRGSPESAVRKSSSSFGPAALEQAIAAGRAQALRGAPRGAEEKDEWSPLHRVPSDRSLERHQPPPSTLQRRPSKPTPEAIARVKAAKSLFEAKNAARDDA
ncbi:hypothetical protein JKP88DRAFT_323850 [Tribonema minus]|uniref:Uncharacterized protein n=1 Tax=Tribonema minus TaxID=303371 RepID=A0A835Z1C8_9STRA|nr:hypothetical protein JKP88DRAFT_323850 [Tribonema minus]